MPVAVTHLQQCALAELRPPESDNLGSRLVQQLRPCPGLARFLYWRIGESCGWSRRQDWTDDDWATWLAHPNREFWVSWQHGQLTGFAELHLGLGLERDTTYIKFLGLLPEHQGLGLGSHLVAQVTRRAWTAHRRVPALPRVERVSLDTTDLDNPRALPTYLARGFTEVRKTYEERDASGSLRTRTRP